MANKSTLAHGAAGVVARAISAPGLRAVDYLRVSTEEQKRGYGIASQGKKTKNHIARKGWDHQGTYKDEGVSGSLEAADRPDLKRLMEDAASVSRTFDVVVVNEGRAIGRTGRAFWRWVWALEDMGIFVAIVDGGIDNTTPDGRREMRRQADYAETEYETIRTRTQGGIQEKAEEGGLTGGKPRYGYRIENQGQKGQSRIAVDRCDHGAGCRIVHEYNVLHRAWELVAVDKLNIRRAALTLNAEGLLTRSGKPWSNRNLWSRLTEAADEPQVVFRHPGRAKLGADGTPLYGNTVVINLAPLFTPEERGRLRAAMADNRRGRKSRGPNAHYPLSGHVVGLCKSRYSGLKRKERDGRVYRCAGKVEKHAGAALCACPTINADELEKLVWEETCKLLGDPKRLKLMSEDWLRLADGNRVNYDERIADLGRQIEEQESALAITMVVAAKQAARRGLSGEAAEEAVQRVLKPLADEVGGLVELRDEAMAWKAETELAEKRASDLQELARAARTRLQDMPSDDQAEVLDLLNIQVTVTGMPPMGRRVDCSLARWFSDRERGVPVLSDAAWRKVEPVLMASEKRQRSNRLPHRTVLDALLFKARTGVPWAGLPEEFGNPTGLQTRYHRWVTTGVWAEAMELLGAEESTPLAETVYPLPPMEIEGVVDPRLFVGVDGAPEETVPVDVVDVFVNSSLAGEVADQAVAKGAKAVWFQLDVIDEAAYARTREAGLDMVMNRCPAIELPLL
ncbi:recombinase family protein [Kitasatospora kazusensis]|uniref:Recombinase family protein n=1 Tax=Kitasatospora kazusensis TaxID=407974 RepID=A0ABN2YR62_9ACTN